MSDLSQAPANVIEAYKRLTAKQKLFATAIPTSSTLVAAALQAGYAPSVAEARAGAMAKDADIALVSNWLISQSLSKVQLTIDQVMGELAALVLADPADLFDPETGAMKPPHQWPKGASRFIAAVDVAEIYAGTGEDREKVGETVKLKFADKHSAINTALKLLDAFPEKKKAVTHTHRIGQVIVPAKKLNPALDESVIESTCEEVGVKRGNAPAFMVKRIKAKS